MRCTLRERNDLKDAPQPGTPQHGSAAAAFMSVSGVFDVRRLVDVHACGRAHQDSR